MVQSKESAADIATMRTQVAVLSQRHTTLEGTMEDVHDSIETLTEKVTCLVINYKVFRTIVGLAVLAGPGIGVILAKQFG